jgi:Family of unknown function (DUF5677)
MVDGPATMSDAKIAKVEDYIGRAVAAVEGTDFYPRAARYCAFDTIASSMMSKAVALAKSCLILLKANQPDEAFGLSRSLMESALIVRYITSDQALQSERTAQFVGFSFEHKNLWLYHARNLFAGQPSADEIERDARRWKLTGDPTQAKKHWSKLRAFTWDAQNLVHPLDDATFYLGYKEKAYAVDYTQTCQWVHCSQPALDNYVPLEGAPFSFIKSPEEFGNPGRTVLYIVVNHLYLVMRFALYAMQIASPEGLHRAFSETLNALVVIDREQWPRIFDVSNKRLPG